MARFGLIGTQYFDDSGDPLIAGLLYFYEPGTTTDKNTYSDVNLTIANTNPVILDAAGRQPDIFFSGSASCVLKNSAGTQIESRDPVGGDSTQNAFADFNLSAIYNIPDIVLASDGNFYISITDGNTGNDPITSATDWTEIKFINSWNTNESYAINDIVQGSNGLLYSAVVAQSGNDPTSDTVNWKPATSGGGVTWLHKTADYTISNGEGVVIDSAGTARTITAPATIAVGHTWTISHLNTSGTAVVVTMARNGHTLRYKGIDVAADITLADGESVTIVCTSATNMEII